MVLEFQRSMIAAVRAALPDHQVVKKPRTPAWLNRPGPTDCGDAWHLVSENYRQLADTELPVAMPSRVRRSLDAVIVSSDGHCREGGGFGAPKPPLFPGQHGRHRQRAFRDNLADLLPPLHGWEPTLRIHHGEAQNWIDDGDATERMRALLAEKLRREQNS